MFPTVLSWRVLALQVIMNQASTVSAPTNRACNEVLVNTQLHMFQYSDQ